MALKRTRRPFWGKWESSTEATANLLDKIAEQEATAESAAKVREQAQELRGKIKSRIKAKKAKAGVA